MVIMLNFSQYVRAFSYNFAVCDLFFFLWEEAFRGDSYNKITILSNLKYILT